LDRSGVSRPYLDSKYSVPENQIDDAERRLGFRFPESYRNFLKTLGSGDVLGVEFYGLVLSKNDLEEIPNALWFNLDLYKNNHIPRDIFVVEDLGGDAFFCLLLSEFEEGECPVILWDIGENEEYQLNNPNIIAGNYGEYFYNRIVESI